MFSKIIKTIKLRKTTYITPSTAIALAALVLSMAGGAFAFGGQGGSGPKAASGGASGGPTTAVATATASKKSKGKAGPRGPAGPKGATGAAGPAGPAGAGGAQGPQGPAGVKGETGTAGTNGTNGTNGEKGVEGSPWTAGGTLPSGKTETGSWSIAVLEADAGKVLTVSLSFSIPLAGEESVTKKPVIEGMHVHIFKKREVVATPGDGCGEGSAAKPEAEPGNLCVYAGAAAAAPLTETVGITDPAIPGGPAGAGTTGAVLEIEVPTVGGGVEYDTGTWAVTAP